MPFPLLVERNVADLDGNLVVAIEHDSLAFRNVSELLSIFVSVPLVLGLTRCKSCAPEDEELGTSVHVVDQELDGHAHPTLIGAKCRHRRHLIDMHLVRFTHRNPPYVFVTDSALLGNIVHT